MKTEKMTGTTLQNYYIESLLGEGGMGRVYKATDTLLGRVVAIKSLSMALTDQPSFLERFRNEAKTLARLAHPNIAVLYNYLQHDSDYYMVMEYVEGENLDELTQRNKMLPCEVVVPVIVQALEGLEHAHHKGVLHRDIKPANIMLTPENTVKLMDFGIAKVSDHAKLTQVSRLIGTLEFLAPELIEGNDPSPASDIYATGVAMYEMLTGKLPFTGKSDYMLMQEIVKESPVTPDNWNHNVPENLSAIILKALEKKPEDRYKSAADFSTALQLAFPDLKQVPPGLLKQQAPPTAVVSKETVVQHVPPLKVAAPTTMLYKEAPATRLGSTAKEKSALPLSSIIKNKFLYIGLAALIIIVFSVTKMFSGNNEEKKNNASGDSAIIQDAQPDASDNMVVEEMPSNKMNSDSVNFILNKKKQEEQQLISTQNDKINTGNNTAATKKPNPQNAENSKPRQPSSSRPKPQEVPKPEQDNEDDVVSSSGPISLRGHGIPLSLALRENISKETASEGQRVSFKVMEAGLLRGKVVIPRGAVVHGTIKGIGLRRMSIIFNSVSAGGRSMHLERSEAGASMENVFSGKSFRVNLRGILTP